LTATLDVILTQGALNLNGNDFTLNTTSSYFRQEGGTFTGGSGTATFTGGFYLTGGTFGAPATINNYSEFQITGGTYTHNSGTVNLFAHDVSYTVRGLAYSELAKMETAIHSNDANVFSDSDEIEQLDTRIIQLATTT